ncbi:MAG: GDSL-type esterase/lipase family protein [Myxococcota bacterium]|nr:GDSL-type esterase/lipase family protein [Myxococcota bacterium]
MSKPGEEASATPNSSAPSSTKRRRSGHWALLVVLTILGSLVAGEAFLQLASWAVGSWVEGRGGTVMAEGGIRILCVGDSHTFGLPLPEEESYPAQLAEALARRHPGLEVEVINLGIPSLNSAFVANRLEEQMHQIRPQLVIVWVGINNLWNVVEMGTLSPGDSWWPWREFLHGSRLFRLASIMWFNVQGHQYDPEQRGGWWEGEAMPSGRLPKGAPKVNPRPGLLRDFARMASMARALDTPILFVAYPFAGQRTISRFILEAGARSGVGVIETAPAMARARADGFSRADLIDERAGPHPSGVLYRYVVEAMLPQVERTLSVWHGLPLSQPASP